MADTIVAHSSGTTGTSSSKTNQVQNLLTHIKSTSDAIDKGDWLGGAMGVANVAMDVLGVAGDPLGAISSAGVGWVLNAVSFLREPFDILMGNPSAISGSANSWSSAANSLANTAKQYQQCSVQQTTSWQGNAGNGYRAASANQANGLQALAQASQAVSSAMTKAGQAVAQARQVVMDLISKAVQQIIQICIEALSSSWLSFGASIAMGIAQSVQKAVSTAQKTLKKVKEVVDTLRQIIQTVQQILQLVQQVKQLLQQIGGKATNQPTGTQQQQAVGYRPDTSGYYQTGQAGYSGTTQPTNAQLGPLNPTPGVPQVLPAGTSTSPSNAQLGPLNPSPGIPQVQPVTGSQPPTNAQLGPLAPGPGIPQVQPVNPVLQAVRAAITMEVLKAVMPLLPPKKAAELLPLLQSAMAEAGITTPQRQAAFLGQLAHESGQFRYMQEIADGSKYEGRRDLGNVNPGDGPLYKGRGPIQLTGRENYRVAGEALGLDLERNPQQVADPKVGFRTAAWYWESRGLNELADDGNYREITRRINGGYNGMADREQYYAAAKKALGL
jgi:predicted chitinase/uncharacterized protein YukE